MRKLLFIWIGLIGLVGKANAQEADSLRKSSLFPIPVAFWSPETRWGAGFAVIYNFYLNPNDTISPPSQIQAGFSVTQNKQKLFYLPYQFFWDERKWITFGQLEYNDFNYFFGEIGEEDRFAGERYWVTFSRARTNVLRRVKGSWYAGGRAWLENWRVSQSEEGGGFDTHQIPGSRGGTTLDLGFMVLNDSRDNVLFPRKGQYLEVVSQHSAGAYGYSRYRLDARSYLSPFRQLVWANQAFIDVTTGDTPFYMMAQLGGSRRMRGYYEGIFREKSGVLYQTELRSMFWRRWGVNAFFSAGMVGEVPGQWSLGNLKYAGGGGVRFILDTKNEMNVRFDVGTGPNSLQYYFTIGEAF